jgi:hypothetical protein
VTALTSSRGMRPRWPYCAFRRLPSGLVLSLVSPNAYISSCCANISIVCSQPKLSSVHQFRRLKRPSTLRTDSLHGRARAPLRRRHRRPYLLRLGPRTGTDSTRSQAHRAPVCTSLCQHTSRTRPVPTCLPFLSFWIRTPRHHCHTTLRLPLSLVGRRGKPTRSRSRSLAPQRLQGR